MAKSVSQSREIWRLQHDGDKRVFIDDLAAERAIALSYNGIAHTVLMCSDQDIIDLAYGFSFTEGIISHSREIYGVEIAQGCNGVEVKIELAGRRFEQLKRARRSMAGRTGCGICGAEQLDHVIRPLPRLANSKSMDFDAIELGMRQLKQRQWLNKLTGATHAAALLDQQGQLLLIREDVGRHIALDKLIGAMLQGEIQGHAIAVTSRASFEMVQKAASAGIEILLAVSAATELAVTVANNYQLTLVGFCRAGRANIYCQPSRIVS
ncbi:formate dehydrogenase accessory sulfurtransferase FdhD [Ferrimonas lipolytica]|uniref:Sulfur carrier protein FdhD n=2 Tax=Ferrimonas lipolytica TaxID=2724191 RepID=A0A6H1ULY9_9GAMM|nr:formate dehydrogenase accessory sulfurtransferase FdhD [Ferrimonas lipolytica]